MKPVAGGGASAMAPSMTPMVFGGGLQRDGEGRGGLDPDEARPLMELSYDKLVYAVGTKSGTFGVPGVREYCYMLKVRV